MLGSYGSHFGQEAVIRWQVTPARILTFVLTMTGTALVVAIIIFIVNWLCLLGICRQIPQNWTTLVIPAVTIGTLAAMIGLRANPKRPFPVGNIIYTITRTALNTLRAIEPVIMGLVFVVWIGLGPFAGVMALMLHSIADLGKLFSEQVENIDEGPLEAVTATGASRLQMIRFAVIPQVVPHYIAFIFYRWDINVRLSTIIGLVGGGGIGFVLFRHTNLLQYRQAAVMVIAIALVVTTLDYVSSRIRQRII